ncbi:MAG: hypothetical protein J6C23_06065 [Clostridia bacterium]|nr:hypothetical protein [Clostridia bacterium]
MTARSGKILRAIVAVLLSACAVGLSVWTVLTEKANVNLAISAGKTSAYARVVQFDTYSNGVMQGSFQNYVSEFGGTFRSNGTATFRNNILSLNRLREGDRVDFAVDLTDKSSIDMQYRVVFECVSDYYGLYRGLEITVGSNVIPRSQFQCVYDGDVPAKVVTDWVSMPSNKKSDYVFISVQLPAHNSQYNGYGTQISVTVQVVPKTL